MRILRLAAVAVSILAVTAPAPAQRISDTRQQVQAAIQKTPRGYTLAPDDVIAIHAPDLGEASDRPITIGEDGYITLPQIGRVRAATMTVPQLEQAIIERLQAYVREPQVTVRIVQFRQELIFVIGAFVKPDTYAYQPNRKLSELVGIAGGLAPTANRRVRVTRQLEFGRIPLPYATEDRDRGVSEVDIDIRHLLENVSSPEDLVLQPSDVISATVREKIYVSGSVTHSGPLELEDRDYLPVTQAISMAGVTSEAAIDKALILRVVEDSNRRARLPVDVKKIMAGQAADFPLLPNDVLVIPPRRSVAGKILAVTLPAAGLVTGVLYVVLR
ncbi:MAG: polysaccharide biosynthesis/export family protein [Acidobacteriota bacterium]